MCINIGIFMLINALALCSINMYFFGNIPIDRFFELMIESLFYPRLLLIFCIVPLIINILMTSILVRFFLKKKVVVSLASILALLVISPFVFPKFFHTSTVPSPFYRESKGNLENSKDFLIAHAGGGIDGHIYTNSREAVENSIEKGYLFIELDLILSKDEKIVAAHDWKHFYKIADLPLVSGEPQALLLEEFKAQKIHGKYATLAYDDIVGFLEKYESMILVTDKLRDVGKLKEERIFSERTIIESFTLKQYEEAKGVGFKYPAYSFSKLKKVGYVVYGNISMIVVPKDMILKYPTIFKNLHERKVTILVYSTDDKEFIEKYQGTHFSLVYTDFL